APLPQVSVRVRLVGSLSATPLDFLPHRKKMCSPLDLGTSKGSNIVGHFWGVPICPVLAARGTYRGCAAAPHGHRIPCAAHRLGRGGGDGRQDDVCLGRVGLTTPGPCA